MSHLKKIVKIITNAFTGILLVLLLLVIYGKLVTTFGKNVYPNYMGYTFFEVASGSMEPALHINDVIIVRITQEDIVKDDIIAYQGEKDVITHRVIFVDGETLTVKGDANNTIDKPIKIDQVIGKIVKVCPKLGVWKKVLTDPKILIAIFVTLILFDFALSYNSSEKPKEEKKPKERKIIFKKEKKKKEEDIIKEVIIPKEEVKEEIKEPPKEEEELTTEEANERLLELTRKINIDEINKLLEGTDLELKKAEINNIKKEVKKIEEEPQEEPNLSEKEQEALDYTIRLDLSEIQKKINERLK